MQGNSSDELDAFMENLQKEINNEPTSTNQNVQKALRTDIEEIDDQESYYAHASQNVLSVKREDEDEYCSDDSITPKKREIQPLPVVDHSSIEYASFEKYFYIENDDIRNLNIEQIKNLREQLDINVVGTAPPPAVSFAYFGFDEQVMETIRRHNYQTPTSIQAQAIPVILSGLDLIGVAQTGSGKTAAYLLPMMVHVISQPELTAGDGPIALVCAPTRELCQQIYHEALSYAQAYNLSVASIHGGANKHSQELLLGSGVEIVVATPVIEHIH